MRVSPVAIYFALYGIAGCGGVTDQQGDANNETDATEISSDWVDCGHPVFEASFIISTILVASVGTGYNLDGEETTCSSGGGCIADPPGGVDNRLEAVSDALEFFSSLYGDPIAFETEIAQGLGNGKGLTLLRIVDLCEFSEDAISSIYSYQGLDTDSPYNPADNFTGSEVFDVTINSLSDPGVDLDFPLYRFNNAIIIASQCHAEADGFGLVIPVGASTLSLPMRNSHINFIFGDQPENIDGEYINGAIEHGIIGGSVPAEQLADGLAQIMRDRCGSLFDEMTFRSSIFNQMDMDSVPPGPTSDPCVTSSDCPAHWRTCVSGFCQEPPDSRDSISIALEFSGVSAVLSGVAR